MSSPTSDDVSHCIDCGSPGRLRLHKAAAEDVLLHRCCSCGLVFNARWQLLGRAVTYDYYRDRMAWPDERLHDPLNESRYADLLEGFEGGARRLLDVGCGVGHLVQVASERGWEAHGIELSPAAVEVCRRFGLSCRVADFLTEELDPPYDLITMIEVIEHVQSPGAFFRRADQLLRPGGVLYVTTPNFSALTRRLNGSEWTPISNEHLTYFTPRSIQTVAGRCSRLDNVDIRAHNLSLSEIRKRLKRPSSPSPLDVGFAGSPSASPDYAMRRRLEQSPLLQKGKRIANAVLTATKGGETLVGTWTKPRVSAQGFATYPPSAS